PVQVPVGDLDVEDHLVDAGLELGPLLVQADAGDQDALDAGPLPGQQAGQAADAGDVAAGDDAAGVGRPQLVDLDAEALQQRLLELELQRRRVRRVDAGRQVGELVLGVEGDAGDAAGGQRLEDGAGEAGGVGLDGVERAGAAGLELVQGRADGPVGDVP